MKPMPAEQFRHFVLKRMPGPENLEKLRAVGIMSEMKGDVKLGRVLQQLATDLEEIRWQGGEVERKGVNGSPRHWKAE